MTMFFSSLLSISLILTVWQQPSITFTAGKPDRIFRLAYNEEMWSAIQNVALFRTDEILTLELQGVRNNFDRAVGIGIYLVPKQTGDSALFLSSIIAPNQASLSGYSSAVSYKIELNSYLTDKAYLQYFGESGVKLKVCILNFSDTKLNGILTIQGIKVTKTRAAVHQTQ